MEDNVTELKTETHTPPPEKSEEEYKAEYNHLCAKIGDKVLMQAVMENEVGMYKRQAIEIMQTVAKMRHERAQYETHS